jgi:hypothetical protein
MALSLTGTNGRAARRRAATTPVAIERVTIHPRRAVEGGTPVVFVSS